MMKKLLLFLMVFSMSFAQKIHWNTVTSTNNLLSKNVERESFPSQFTLIELNSLQHLKTNLEKCPDRFTNNKGVIIGFPNALGEVENFELFESSNFDPVLQAQFPEIRSYIGQGIDDKHAQIRISIDSRGIQTMIFRSGKKSEFMEPYTVDGLTYAIYETSRSKGKLPFTCYTEDEVIFTEQMNKFAQTVQASDQTLRIFRLALSCNGEYAQYFGGTVAGALAAMNATMTRVNGVFEKDFSIRMNLIANNSLIIYTNPSTDPYTSMGSWSGQLQTTLNNVIGAANYDVGHMFGSTGGGGFAGCIGCVCNDANKGSAYTSPADGVPMGDTFDIDYVAHEFGHQFGANHTFSHEIESGTNANVEPGSGSTIMGYAGITNFNVQNNSDDYFHFRSIQQVMTNMATKFCQTNQQITNQPPTVDAGGTVTIPIGTPFILTGTASDPNGDALLFTWEQMNSANNANSGANSIALPTKTAGPLFRSLPPNSNPVRYMPAFSSVLNNQLTTTWESVSNVGRTLSFAFTARDNSINGPQTQTQLKAVTVSSTIGPFQVTSQNASGVSWNQNSQETITWNVNNTNSLAGASNVDILLSTDNGLTFNTILAANTPNDGSETITVPNVAAPFCRIMIRPTGNIFYALNSTTFAIGYTVNVTCNTYNGSPMPIITSGNIPANQIGTINVPMTGQISSVSVFNNITHTYLSDVVTDISSPQNPSSYVRVYNRLCGNTNGTLNLRFNNSGNPINCTAGGTVLQTVASDQSLSVFNGQNPQGNWTLRVYDIYTGDNGNLNSWGVEICTQTLVLNNPDFGLVDFAVYPNPNRGNFTVKFDNQSNQSVNIQVLDIQGRSVYQNQYAAQGMFQQEIQLPNVPIGVYLVKVSNGEFQEVKKIVVQ
ncbi:MAG: reprolysin-like metallopeptidase [Flavobacterium sp.]